MEKKKHIETSRTRNPANKKARARNITKRKKKYKIYDRGKVDKSQDKSSYRPNTGSTTIARDIINQYKSRITKEKPIKSKAKAMAKEKNIWLHRKDLLRPP